MNLLKFILKLFKKHKGIPKPPGKRADILLGLGMPWSWNHADPVALANALYNAGCTATLIEMDLWNTDPGYVANWISPFRQRGITVEIIIINGNSLDLFNHDDAWFNNIVDGLIKKVGYDRTILQAICEPGNKGGDLDKMRRWMKYAYSHWKGLTSIGDHWPVAKEFQHGRTFIERHHCSDPNESNLINGLNTTDCTLTLSMSPDRAYHSAKAALKVGKHFILYDARFDHSGSIDYQTINAIGRAIQES